MTAAQSAHRFHLSTIWRIDGSIEEISAVLADVERLPQWWASVYLDVRILEPGDEHGIGRVVAFHTRGRLPYTLRWQGRVIEANRPHSWTIEASGDLDGIGVWRLEQNGAIATVLYDWQVSVDKPILRFLSPLLKPLFAANHRWAMAKGLEGLSRELARRRAP